MRALDSARVSGETGVMDFDAIILAGGSGSRVGGQPKQWRPLAGRPVARWSLDAMAAAGAHRIVLVAPADQHDEAAAASSYS